MPRRLIALAVTVGVLIALLPLLASDTARRGGRLGLEGMWSMGYYVGYQRDAYPVADITWESLTHIAVGMVVPRGDGTLDDSFGVEGDGPAWACGVVDEAHRHGRQALLVLGGANTRGAFAVAASAHRDRLVGEVVALADRCGFDGVDLDWEPLRAEDGACLLALTRALRQARPGMTLTAALSPVNVNEPHATVHPFVEELATVVDRLNVMTYGMNGDWAGWSAWHSSPLSGHTATTPTSVETTYEAYLRAGVPPSTLGIGVGLFGVCMKGVTGPGQGSPRMTLVGDDNVMSYAEIMRHYYRPDALRWDPVAQVPYLSSTAPLGPGGCSFVSYEDERSIAAKADFASSRGLGGVIIWNLNLGHRPELPPGRRDPLLDAVGRAFRG